MPVEDLKQKASQTSRNNLVTFTRSMKTQVSPYGQGLNQEQRPPKENSLTRFLKAKERAEFVQGVRVGKLKKMLELWGKKEKDWEQYKLDTIEELKHKKQVRRAKIQETLKRAEKYVRQKEEQSMRDYRNMIKELA